MAGEEGEREEQMSVTDLKPDTKDDSGREGSAQREKLAKLAAAQKPKREKRAFVPASKLPFQKEARQTEQLISLRKKAAKGPLSQHVIKSTKP